MTPGHLFDAQTKPSPFVTQPEKTSVETNGKLKIILHSPEAQELFKGYLLIAVDADTQKPVGSFGLPKSASDAKTKSCQGTTQNMVTHTDNTPKSSVGVTWNAPKNWEGTVIFKTTFVQDFSTFWVKESSVPVRVTREIDNSVPSSVNVTTAANSTSSNDSTSGILSSSSNVTLNATQNAATNGTVNATITAMHVNGTVDKGLVNTTTAAKEIKSTKLNNQTNKGVTDVANHSGSGSGSTSSFFDISSLFRSLIHWLFG